MSMTDDTPTRRRRLFEVAVLLTFLDEEGDVASLTRAEPLTVPAHKWAEVAALGGTLDQGIAIAIAEYEAPAVARPPGA